MTAIQKSGVDRRCERSRSGHHDLYLAASLGPQRFRATGRRVRRARVAAGHHRHLRGDGAFGGRADAGSGNTARARRRCARVWWSIARAACARSRSAPRPARRLPIWTGTILGRDAPRAARRELGTRPRRRGDAVRDRRVATLSPHVLRRPSIRSEPFREIRAPKAPVRS